MRAAWCKAKAAQLRSNHSWRDDISNVQCVGVTVNLSFTNGFSADIPSTFQQGTRAQARPHLACAIECHGFQITESWRHREEIGSAGWTTEWNKDGDSNRGIWVKRRPQQSLVGWRAQCTEIGGHSAPQQLHPSDPQRSATTAGRAPDMASLVLRAD